MSRCTAPSDVRQRGRADVASPGAAMRGAVVGAVVVALAGIGAPADAAPGPTPTEPVVSGAVVNSGKDVIVGITHDVAFPVTVTGADDSGLSFVDVDLKGPHGGFYTTDAFCETATACTTAFTVNAHPAPGSDDPVDLANANAGTWKVDALVDTHDGDSVFAPGVASFGLKRAARLTVNAAPEPVAKGATITVTGKLVRANWDTYRYAGYTGQAVKLQFRPKDSDTYTTVATVNTNSTGNLHAKVKAAKDGYWRWNFAGTTTTGPAKAAGDYVDVR
ncbi:calcium-binding protein [Streptomyces cinnabarinus]|uniref:Calcium-binding protein n=1 Tax=Streptomyces cinnabarinus TaxID=67287 RepID=A0ABY7KT11_9ACTN|nr:calcium-binding protein [Streptomyces cinnabarinus]WAZ26227.1 calcium-binding protein [Streptomyces cinnabarinus]